MKTPTLSFLFLLIINFLLCINLLANVVETSSEKTISFYEAVGSGKVKFSVTGNGGYNGECLSLKITNVTRRPLVISVEPGTRFKSESDWMQDLMVTQEALLAMHPLRESQFGLFTMCTQHSNASPKKGEVFTLNNKAEGPLLALAETIDRYGYQNSSAQSAVWATVDHTSCAHVYGEDLVMVKRLREIVQKAVGAPCDMENLTPREHTITSLNTSMEYLLKLPVKDASLTLYDANGTVVKKYFQNQVLAPGFYHFKVGVHHTFGDSARFILKLEEAGNIVFQKEVTAGDSIPTLTTLPTDIFANFEMKTSDQVRIGVYDAAGELYILLADNHGLPAGMNRITFKGGRDLPLNKKYFLQVRKGKEVLISQNLSFDEEEPSFNPIVKRGTFRVTLSESIQQARMEVVDEKNRVVWVVFEKSALSYGAKNIPFVFQHTQGPNAQFTVRLLDGAGNAVKEQTVKGR